MTVKPASVVVPAVAANERAKGTLHVCPNDGEPVIWTFKYPGYEFVCVVCGWLGGALRTPRGVATAERVKRHGELQAQFNEANGIEPEPPLPANPVCVGCGEVAPEPHKPPNWYAKGSGSETRYACSRNCLPVGEMVMPW